MGRDPKLRRFAFAIYLVAVHAALGLLLYSFIRSRIDEASRIPSLTDPTEAEQSHTPEPQATPCVSVSESPPVAEGSPLPVRAPNSIIIPVSGLRADQLTNTFAAARSDGRTHDAIDIVAPAGTPVVAAVKGKIVKFFDSIPGGITIYQLSEDGKYIYYYAHLQRRADGLTEGQTVEQGTVIAYVGDTGNAGAGNYHLHFSIARTEDPKKYWTGTYLNPYPYLTSGQAPQ